MGLLWQGHDKASRLHHYKGWIICSDTTNSKFFAKECYYAMNTKAEELEAQSLAGLMSKIRSKVKNETTRTIQTT